MSAPTEFSAATGIDLAYGELRRLAAAYLRGENQGRTLEPAVLVNEAYIRMTAWEGVHWRSRSHFIGVAAMIMRQVVWTYARRRNALKRGAGGQRVTLTCELAGGNGGTIDALLMEEALRRLELESQEACRVVEMRVFGGLTVPEIATAMNQSESTVKRHWVLAKTWLKRYFEATQPA